MTHMELKAKEKHKYAHGPLLNNSERQPPPTAFTFIYHFRLLWSLERGL
jgi:hypothetical protein